MKAVIGYYMNIGCTITPELSTFQWNDNLPSRPSFGAAWITKNRDVKSSI